MNKRKAAVRERVLSLMMAMLLVITGIPVNGLVVNAEELEPEATVEATEPVENTDETDEVSDDVIDAEEVNDENEEEMPVAEEPADEEEKEEEKGGETYQVIAGDYADYVSIYREVDGIMEEVADVASESFVAGDKVCVVVKEGYAWTLLVDDSELEADEELEGYVFTIGEEDLKLAEVYAIEAGDGVETTEVKEQSIIGPSKVTYKGEDINVTVTPDANGSGDYVITLETTYGTGNTSIPADSVVAEITYTKGSTIDAFLCNAKLVGDNTSGNLTAYTITIPADVLKTDGGESDSVTLSAKFVDVYAVTVTPQADTIDNVTIEHTKAEVSNETDIHNDGLDKGTYKAGTKFKVSADVTADDNYWVEKVSFGTTDIAATEINQTYSTEFTVSDAFKGTQTIAITATVKPALTANVVIGSLTVGSETLNADKFSDYVAIDFDDVKFIPSEASNEKVEGKITAKDEKYTVAVNATCNTISGFSLNLTENAGVWSGTTDLSSATDNVTIKLDITLTAKEKATIDLTDATKITVTNNDINEFTAYQLKASDFTLYKSKDGKTYEEVKADTKLYKGDNLAIGTSKDWVTLGLGSGSEDGATNPNTISGSHEIIAVGETKVNAVTFTAGEGAHTLTIKTTLSKDLVQFNEGNYKVYDSEGKVLVDPTSGDKVYVMDKYTTFTLKPEAGYKLTNVAYTDTSTQNTVTDKLDKCEVELTFGSAAERKVEVTATQGYTIEVDFDSTIESVYYGSDSTKQTFISAKKQFYEKNSITLYFELKTTKDATGNVTAAPYKWNVLNVNGVDKTASKAMNGDDNDIYLYSLTLNLTEDVVITANAIYKKGDEVKFEGSHYSAYVLNAGYTFDASSFDKGTNTDGVNYQAKGTYSIGVDEAKGEVILLVADDNYRFTDVELTSFDKDKDFTYQNSGKYVVLSGLKTSHFTNINADEAGCRTLTLEAELEQTYSLTLKDAKNVGIANSNGIKVTEDDYKHHETAGVAYTEKVNTNTTDYIYQVAKNSEVTVEFNVNEGYKITDVKLGDKDLEVEQDTDVKTKFTVTVSISKASELTYSVALDEVQLQGLKFQKGNYLVYPDNSGSKGSTALFGSFEKADEEGNVLQLYSKAEIDAMSNELVLYVEAIEGYAISEITYDGETVYLAETPSAPSEYDGVKYDASDSKLTIATSALKNNDEQLVLEVKTDAASLDDDYTFELKAAANQTYKNTDAIFFSAYEEIKVNSVSADKTDDKADSFYTFYEVAESTDPVYIAINVTVDDANVTPVLKFYDSDNNEYVENIIVDTSKEDKTYTFSVSAAALAAGEVDIIYVDGVVSTQKVNFTYNTSLVEISMSTSYSEKEDGDYLYNRLPYADITGLDDTQYDEDGNKLEEKVATYLMRTGESVDVTIKARKSGDRQVANLTSVTEAVSVTESEAYITLAKIDSDHDITIAAEKLSAKVLTQNNDTVAAEEDGTYVISYKTEYKASYVTGAETVLADAATFTVGGTARSITKPSNGVATFKVNQADAGKTAVLTLQKSEIVDGKTELKDVASFNFVIAETLTADGFSVAGVVDGVITQTAGTQEEYALTIPDGATINDLKATATNSAIVEIVDGYLVVTAPASAASDKASTITLSNGKTGVKLQTITLKTVEVAGLVDAKLSVQALTSTDKALRMNLTATGVADVDVVNGEIAFMVTVENQSSKNDTLLQKTFYVKRDPGAEVTYSGDDYLRVVSKATKENKYNVTIQLVRLDANNKVIVKSTEILSIKNTDDFVVAPTYYTNADELNLKNQVNTVNRGKWVAVADVDFGEHANQITINNVRQITLYDSTGELVPQYDEIYEAYVEADKLYFYANGELDLGIYTLKVNAARPDMDTIAATASMTLKVEEGIWELKIADVPDTLLKLDGKAASFTAKAVFNNGNAGVKNTKVTWSIIPEISDNAALLNMVKISTGGKVTVDKNYVLSTNEQLNTFYVKAVSDATGKKDIVKVVLTKEAVDLGEFVLVEANSAKTKFTKVDQTMVSSDLACSGDLYLIAVKSNASSKSSFTTSDMMTTSVSVKTSNKKLAVDYAYLENAAGDFVCAYELYAGTVLNNVKVTFTALDGSKKTAVKTFNIAYADMSNMVMEVEGKTVNGSYSFVGTSEDTLTVRLGKSVNGKFQAFDGVLNTKVSISGGKILSSNVITNTYEIKLNKDTATLTVANKGDKTATPLTCVFTNTAYAGFSKTAAPTVATTTKSINANSVNEQSITYTFKKATDYKFVKAQIAYADEYKLTSKNVPNIYSKFKQATGMTSLGYVVYPIKDNSFTITFKEGTALSAGAYKVYLSYGTYDAHANFVPETKAGNVTIKAVASKSVDYTLDSNYTMSLLDTASISLTGKEAKGTDVTLTLTGAYSTVQEGAGNLFGKLFTIDKETNELTFESYAKLSETLNKGEELKAGNKSYNSYAKWLAALAGTENAADLTGYVTYRVNGGMEEQAKVSVNLSKEALKSYSASTVTLLAGKEVSVPVSIYANNTEIKLNDAATTKTPFKGNSNGKTGVTVEDGALTLMTTSTPSVGETTTTLTIVPETSFYPKYDSSLKNGIDVTVNVEALNDAETIISFDDVTVSFTEFDGKGYYVGYIPYTNEIANAIKKVEATDSKLKNVVKFEAGKDGESIKVTVAQAEFEKTSPVVNYGDTVDVDVKVTFCSGASKSHTFKVKFPSETSLEAADKAEVFTNIRKAIWDKPLNGDVLNQNFPTAVDFNEANELKLAADELYNAKEFANATKAYEKAAKAYEKAAVTAVEAAVKAQLILGAAVEAKVELVNTITLAKPSDKVSTNGALEVKVTLTGNDVTNDTTNVTLSTPNTYELKTYVAVDTVSAGLNLYYTRLVNFAGELKAGQIKELPLENGITAEDILSVANSVVLDGAESTYILKIVDDSWSMKQATSLTDGKFSLDLQVLDMYDLSNDSCKVLVNGVIDQLDSVSDVKKAFTGYFSALVDGTLSKYVEDNKLKHEFDFNNLNINTSAENIGDLAQAAIDDCGNSGISYSFAEDKDFELVKVEKDGANIIQDIYKVTGTIVFTETVNNKTYKKTYDFDRSNVTFNVAADNTLRDDVVSALQNNLTITSNTQDGVKAIIEHAVAGVVKNNPYSFEVSITSFTAPTATASGAVAYTISFDALDNSADIEAINYNNMIDASENYLSLDEAVDIIKAKFATVNVSDVKGWFTKESDGTYSLKETTSGTFDAIAAIGAYLTDVVNKAPFKVSFEQVIDEFHSAYVSNYTYTEETVKEDGRIELSIKVTANDKDENDNEVFEVITLTKTINQINQTKDDAKAKITALKASDEKIKSFFKKTVNEVAFYDYLVSLIDENKYAVNLSVEINPKSNAKTTIYDVVITLCNETLSGDVIATNSFSVTLS